MKFFSTILAVYFLALSFVPCSDENFIDTCGMEQSCSHVDASHSEHHDADGCNPLCMCNCCGGVTVVSNSENHLIAQLPTEQISFYTQNSTPEISFSIWQPPKIG